MPALPLLLGLLLHLLLSFSPTRPPSCVLAILAIALYSSWTLGALRSHVQGAREVEALTVSGRLKSLTQVSVAIDSWYCAKRRSAAGPKAGNSKKTTPMLCIYLG